MSNPPPPLSLPPVGKHAVPQLVADLPGGPNQSARALSEETVVSVLSTLAEVLGGSLEAAKTLRTSQGIERLVLINKDGWVGVPALGVGVGVYARWVGGVPCRGVGVPARGAHVTPGSVHVTAMLVTCDPMHVTPGTVHVNTGSMHVTPCM